MANQGDSGSRSHARRISIAGKIDLEFPNFDGLVTRMSANLSVLGMFVEGRASEPTGTQFRFNLQVDDWSAIQGTAEVVWIRPEPDGPERPAGMGVKFLELDPQSRRIVRWLVEKHQQEGGRPFDLETVPVGASKYRGREKTAADGGRSSSHGHGADDSGTHDAARASRIRGRWIVVGSILAITIGLSAYRVSMDHRPGRGRLQPPGSGMEEPPDRPIRDGAAGVAPTGAPAISMTAQPDSIEAISELIRVWSSAVESQDVATLERLYTADRSGTAPGQESQRQASLSSDRRIGISALEVEFPSTGVALATFNRSTQSPTGVEVRRMVLELELVAGSWRIRQERFLD